MRFKSLNENDIKKILSLLDKKSPAEDFEHRVLSRIADKDFVPGIFEALFKTAKVSFIAAVCLFCVFATFNYFIPPSTQNSGIDNIEALNYYVFKDNCPEKKMVDIILG